MSLSHDDVTKKLFKTCYTDLRSFYRSITYDVLFRVRMEQKNKSTVICICECDTHTHAHIYIYIKTYKD
jgi:hypothetical protein